MQDEGVHVRAKLGDNEWHPLCHQAGDEMDVAAQTIELGDGNGATTAASLGERGGKLWSSASAPLPVSISMNSRTISNSSATTNRASASRCASRPRPERPCAFVDTRQ